MCLCRYLKSCMWQEDKKKEMQERKFVQSLYRDLVGKAKLNELNKKVHGNLNVLILRLENISNISNIL